MHKQKPVTHHGELHIIKILSELTCGKEQRYPTETMPAPDRDRERSDHPSGPLLLAFHSHTLIYNTLTFPSGSISNSLLFANMHKENLAEKVTN